MTDRLLTVSFGTTSPAVITSVKTLTWQQFAHWLTKTPPVVDDKAARGWYCPTEFNPVYRDSDNFVARHAITFDFDHIGTDTWDRVFDAWGSLTFAIYTTFSHTPQKPRFRVVMPLSRPCGYDEYQAVVRKVATDMDIELFARESFTPAQMMFAPTQKADAAEFASQQNVGEWLNVDDVLAEYADWTDHKSWPHRSEGDGVHKIDTQTRPDEKPGPVGDFCRAFRVADAIARFDLPYTPTSTPGRWTYTNGSRPEGAIEYDDGLKFHSHHDTDPARGQNNAFDLVRLHRFGELDKDAHRALPVAERPSYRSMCELSSGLAEVRSARVSDFGDLGPLAPDERPEINGARAFARRLDHVLSTPTSPDWLIEDTIERGVIAILAGPRGSYKSFISLDWTMRVVTRPASEPAYVISGEGGDFDRRSAAWLKHFMPERDPSTIPLYIVERRIDLSQNEGIEQIRQDCLALKIRPVLFVLDTFSKLSGGLEENDNSEVKQFIGRLDNGLKRSDTGFGATVLLVAHTGHSDTSRARGASALAADTDAEYIASRNVGVGSVNVSRERFKSSPELSPLCYAPRVIDLGRRDKGGRPISSLVMEPAEPPVSKGKKGPSGTVQKVTLQILKTMAPSGESVEAEDLIAGIAAKLTKGDGQDKRRAYARRAIDALIANEMIFQHGETRVALTPVKALAEGDWV